MRHFIDKCINNFRQSISIMNIMFIFLTEYIYYLWTHNYPNFIGNVAHRLMVVNVLYVKIFQALALNGDLINEEIRNELIKFTDNAPWTDTDIDWPLLNRVCHEYNIKLENAIPINSGMISLVFKGEIKGDPVAIKCLRNNIHNTLNLAIENLFFIIYLLSLLPIMSDILNKYKIQNIIKKNVDIILQQTNFKKEIDNMIQFKQNCVYLKYVKIPYVYKKITEKYDTIIVMEFINGLKITQIPREDYQPFAKQLIKFGIVTLTIHGLIHGDLHCGNILFIKNENQYIIGILDFGIVNYIPSSFKDMLLVIAKELFHSSSHETAEKLLSSGLIEPHNLHEILPINDYNNILNLTAEIVEETISNSKNTNQLQLYKFVTKFNNYLLDNNIAKYGIRPSDNFVKAQLIIAMTQGVVLMLCKENIISLVDSVINELFHLDILYI